MYFRCARVPFAYRIRLVLTCFLRLLWFAAQQLSQLRSQLDQQAELQKILYDQIDSEKEAVSACTVVSDSMVRTRAAHRELIGVTSVMSSLSPVVEPVLASTRRVRVRKD